MASIVTNLTCELTAPVSVVFLPGNMFSMDNGGNIINVFVVQNGEPVALGGSVSANVIRSDGTTVAITGAFEGNKAYIILPQACYAVPGIIHIVMKITEGTTITTIAAITANVYQSSTDAIVDPGNLVPSVAALIAQIEAAVDSIPVDYSGLLLTLAKDYTQKPYIVGEYAWQGGVLKRCIVPITTAETYTAAHWTNAVLGDDVTALKSALNAQKASTAEEVGIKLGSYTDRNVQFLQGGINPSTGEFNPGNTKRTTTEFIYIPDGATVSASVETGYIKSNFVWFNAQKTYIGQGNPMPTGARYVRLLVQKSDGTQDITPAEAQSNTTFIITQPYSVAEIKSNLESNDAKTDAMYPMFEAYNDYVIEKNNVSSKMTYGAFGAAYNDASYSNGVLTIPSGKTGASSYIGVRITGGFALLKKTIARVRIVFDDISGVDLETKILKSPNTNNAHIINSEISAENNTVEYTFLIDSDTFTYLFLGIMVKTTASAQASQKVITYQSATIYSSESYDNPVKMPIKIQLFGDSITDDIRVVNGSETTITTWASKITEYMPDYDLTIINSAVGGSGIGHGKSPTARYSTKTYNYVHDLVTDGTLVTDCDVITMLIGTNNWRGEGGGSFGTLGELGDDTVSTFYGAANLVCKYISENTNALFIIITPPQRYNSSDQTSPTNSLGEVLNGSNHTLKDYCKALKEVAALYGYPVIDLNDELGWNKYNVGDYTSDGLHPSATKCGLITRKICGALKMFIGD